MKSVRQLNRPRDAGLPRDALLRQRFVPRSHLNFKRLDRDMLLPAITSFMLIFSPRIFYLDLSNGTFGAKNRLTSDKRMLHLY